MHEDAASDWVNGLEVAPDSGFCPPYPNAGCNITWLIGLTTLP